MFFTSIFEGNGHHIHNLYIKNTTQAFVGGRLVFLPMGLFDNIGNNGVVRNLILHANVTGGHNTGALVGQNFGVIQNVLVTGTVSGSNNVGGVVGAGYPAVLVISKMCFLLLLLQESLTMLVE